MHELNIYPGSLKIILTYIDFQITKVDVAHSPELQQLDYAMNLCFVPFSVKFALSFYKSTDICS